MAIERDIQIGAPAFERDETMRVRIAPLRRLTRTWLRKPLGVFGLVTIVLLSVIALGAPVVQRYDPVETFSYANPNYNPSSTNFFNTDHDQTFLDSKAGPSMAHWFGTDDGGRDLWSRIVWGTRRSLGIGVAALAIAVAVGTAAGVISGYFGGKFDTIFQRLLDGMQAFPVLLVLILAATVFEASVRNLILTLGLIGIPQVSRLVRGTVLQLREMPFIEAGRVIGASDLRLMTRHILPNSYASVIVVFTIGIGTVIVAEASLAFLALAPPGISWGFMLSAGVSFINESPWQAVFSGGFISLAVLAFNLFGDALRDVLDPRLRI